jgi:hypothetical protein
MGKLSFLNLSGIGVVEFHSNNGSVGMQVFMTMDGFSEIYKDSQLVLPHRGLKVIIKKAKRSSPDSRKIIEYLSKNFALRIAGGAKIFVDEMEFNIPSGFDSHKLELFRLSNGLKVQGNLKNIEKPEPNNVDIFVKQVYADSKGFDYKVQGWLNCDGLDLATSRDSIFEGNDRYIEFMNKLMQHLDENFEKKLQSKDKDVKSKEPIAKMFVNIINR